MYSFYRMCTFYLLSIGVAANFDSKLANVLENEDLKKGETLMKALDRNKNNFKFVQEEFYKITSQTFSEKCSVVKFIGGEWISTDFSCAEGSKAICLDQHFLDSVKNGKCLVYSFGIADDWSFEDAMGKLGCQVRAFDPTIDAPEKRSENVTFAKLGIAQESGMARVLENVVPVKTLQDIIVDFGDTDKDITYIKLDVEGWEVFCLPIWAKDPVLLRQIRQIGVEMHMGVDDDSKRYVKLIKTFQKMYQNGFHIVSYVPNYCQEKTLDFEKKYHTHFDLLLVNKSQ